MNNFELVPYGVVIGRFQTSYLHEGHKALLLAAADSSSHVVVCVGVRDTPPTKTNPLSYRVRERMIRDFLSEHISDFTIIPMPDFSDDVVWSKNFDATIRRISGGSPAAVLTGRMGFNDRYHGNLPVKVMTFDIDHESATQIRQDAKDFPANLEQEAFREGMIHQMMNFVPVTYNTVDIVVVRPSAFSKCSVLLGRKPNESKFRFPGGFVDFGETSVRAAARELCEETGLFLSVDELHYLGEVIVKDWRTRDTNSAQTKTTLFLGKYQMDTPKASDDLEELRWVEYNALGDSTLVVDTHLPLVDLFMSTEWNFENNTSIPNKEIIL